MRNHESGDDGTEENDGMLVLMKSPLNIRRFRPCRCNNCRKYTELQLFYSSYNYDSDKLYSVSRQYLSGQPIPWLASVETKEQLVQTIFPVAVE